MNGRRKESEGASVFRGPSPARLRVGEAQRAAALCACCGEAIPPGAPVWLGPVPAVGGLRGRIITYHAPLCARCAQPSRRDEICYLPAHPCAGCGRPVNRLPSSRRLRYVACSEDCRRACYRASRRAKEGPRPRACAACGREFLPARRDAEACCPVCRQHAYRPPRRGPATPRELKAGDRVRVTARSRLYGYRPGDKGAVLRKVVAGLGGNLYYLVAMDKDDPRKAGLVFADGEIEPDG